MYKRQRFKEGDVGQTADATALNSAAQGGNEVVVSMLIAGGADVNAASGAGTTPLHLAAYGGHV